MFLKCPFYLIRNHIKFLYFKEKENSEQQLLLYKISHNLSAKPEDISEVYLFVKVEFQGFKCLYRLPKNPLHKQNISAVLCPRPCT